MNEVVEVGKEVYDEVVKGWLRQRRWDKEGIGVMAVLGTAEEARKDEYDEMHEAVALMM